MKNLIGSSKIFMKRNASTILTVIGGAGVVTTTVLAIKATPKALTLLDEAKKEKGEDLTRLEKIKTAAPVYIPTVLIGAGTLACIFGANALNKKQQAGLMSAYALLDGSYKNYKSKVNELYGEDANQKVVEEIAKETFEEQEEMDRNPEEILVYDEFSDQYFTTTKHRLVRAEYEVNRSIQMFGGISLNDFYEVADAEPIEGGEELGWSEGGNLARYWQGWVDFGYKHVLLDEETECVILTMQQEPYLYYDENY